MKSAQYSYEEKNSGITRMASSPSKLACFIMCVTTDSTALWSHETQAVHDADLFTHVRKIMQTLLESTQTIATDIAELGKPVQTSSVCVF